MPARLVLLATSPRVAPGLLSFEAWSVLGSADRVLVGEAGHAMTEALRQTGIEVLPSPAATSALDLAHRLLAGLDAGTTVYVASPDGDPGLAESLAALLDGLGDLAPDVDVVLGSWDLPGARLLDLVAVMDRLRSPGGCPWDAQQTHESLVEYLLEEAYETVEAIESGDDADLREELGDLLLQVVFHARIAEEHEQPWTVDDVADGITAKLVSRHPHVFAGHEARTAEEVEASWTELKRREKGRDSVTDGIPQSLPALTLAAKLLRRSAHVDGVDWVSPELEDAADRAYDAADGDVGDLLLALVARMSDTDEDPEQQLRHAIRRHRARVRAAEGLTDRPSD
ncbi:MAG TPA: MazG family protein [Candidatus Angelobacter sp.]|nr:MazG family protein [Candidatus Angelobacter sp.]